MLLAEGFYDLLCLFQLVAWHTGEEMMLDLVIESAIPEVIEGMSIHIAGRDDLPTQEIQLRCMLQDGHSLVVRREG